MGSCSRGDCASMFAGALALLGAAVLAGAGHALIQPISMKTDWSNIGGGGGEPSRDVEVPSTLTDGGNSSVGEVEADGPFISLDRAYELFSTGEAVFIDSRREEEFAVSRIPGAVFLDAAMLTSGRGGEALNQLISYGYGQLIVLYCYGGDCDASDNTARELMKIGFTNMRKMKASFDDWKSAGYEIEEGE